MCLLHSFTGLPAEWTKNKYDDAKYGIDTYILEKRM